MADIVKDRGYLYGGMPYNRFGHGPKEMVIFQGLMFDHQPLPTFSAFFFEGEYRFLQADYPLYLVNRKQGLPDGYTLRDLANDYALMIEQTFGKPVDVLGVSNVFVRFLFPNMGWLSALAGPLSRLITPKDPTDFIRTIEAEDLHAFKDRLSEISAPTLVIAGDLAPFYTPQLFRETAQGIPHARLILYEAMGHPALGKQFQKDVLAFLRAD